MIQIDTDQKASLAEMAVDLTPLLDILFIVLIFFILTANPVQLALQVELPTKGADQAEVINAKTALTITLFHNQQWGLNHQIFYDWPSTEHALRKAIENSSQNEIVIATDRDVAVERLLEVMAFLKQQNLQVAQIQMKTASKP